MAGLFQKIQKMWNVPDDEYDEIEEEEQEEQQDVNSYRSYESRNRYDDRYSENRYSESRYSESRYGSYHEEEPPVRAAKSREVSGTSNGSKVVNIHATTQLQVVLFKPERFGEEARMIADELLKMHTVVLNLEDTNKDVARRIVDFLSGVAYANGGKIKRVATDTFIITPYNVDLMGDDVLDELESSGVSF